MGVVKKQRAGLRGGAQFVLNAVRRHTFMTAHILAESDMADGRPLGANPSSVRKRKSRSLKKLHDKRFLKCFALNDICRRGAPEKVYCPREVKIPRSQKNMPHQLEIVRCAMAVETACRIFDSPRYRVDFGPEYSIDLRTSLNDNRPDLALCVSSATGKALYFLEVDLGTEAISAGSLHARGDIQSKFRRYMFMTDSELHKYNQTFQHAFRGFRVLVVTTRPEPIIKAALVVGTRDAIGIAHVNAITPNSVLHEPIWTVPGYGIERSHRFNWTPTSNVERA